eukprot:NODE_3327_length_2052_cov_8.360519.p1 GENE.NODE_3327_length_2052_cov_8.360519~~NODE_3327_length_2052_cov_8.360519.p1  ORF type:complete len:428 (-),score=129.53 NODE_3327_length_2052_cov_8.360519:726-2009(-)
MASGANISSMGSCVGKKNGEIKCFRDGGTTFAFAWNQGGRTWDKIGEVVGSQQPKVSYPGDSVFPSGEYDFVWDVDMGPAIGMRKLPYNRGDNPMVVAESFCSREQIHKGNGDQIREFIRQNSDEGGAPPPAAAASAAPAAPPPPPQPAVPESTMFPVLTHISFKAGKFEALQAKLLEFNAQMDASLQINPTDTLFLTEAIGKLKSGNLKLEIRNCEKEVFFMKLGAWPREQLFPVIDLWRLFLLHPQSCDSFKGSDRGTAFLTQVTGLLSEDTNGPLGLCCARYLVNLFMFPTNRSAAFDKREFLLRAVAVALGSTNKLTRAAGAALILNFAIVLHERSFPPKQWDAVCGAELTRLALGFLATAGADDADGQQKCVLALGTLLPRDRASAGTVKQMIVDAGLPAKLDSFEAAVGSNAIVELRKLLA